MLPAVLLALNTGMRYSEFRLLHWERIDLQRRVLRDDKAAKVPRFWADQFPDRKPEHVTFPSERYGAGGDDFTSIVFDVDPKMAIGSWKEAWESVKRTTGIDVRFHDLRHTCVTRMLEGGVPLSVVASILGWSPATTARMAKRYGHIGQVAMRQAVEVLQKVAQPRRPPRARSSASAARHVTIT